MTAADFRASFELRLPDFNLAPRFEMGPEMAVLFGASGAGKSLTLRALAGLVRPDQGSIHLNGHALFDSEEQIDLPPQDRGIGYVPQHYALFPHQSIAKNVAFGLHDLPNEEREARVSELLSRMQLERLADRKPGEVSGGQQQRTALARALARRPDLLLMDEPFAAVEEDLRAHLREELLRIQKDFAIPVLLVTHSRAEAYALAERLIVISEGEIVQSGSRDKVFRRPRTPTVARLMGMTNILQVTIVDGSGPELLADWGDFRLKIAYSASSAHGGTLTAGVRPEEIRIAPAGSEAQPANRLTARLVKDEPQGADHVLQFEVNDQSLDVRVSHPEFVALDLAAGQMRTLAVEPQGIHVITDPD
ncbi:MAG: ABC transporter ATP-binding protein [Anaerolineales bacterium]